MIDGLTVTVSGEDLRNLLDVRITHHERCADRWAREKARTTKDENADAPLAAIFVLTEQRRCTSQ